MNILPLPKFCPPLSLQHTYFANVSYTEGTQQTLTLLLHLWMSVAFGTVTPRNVQSGYLSQYSSWAAHWMIQGSTLAWGKNFSLLRNI